MANLNRYEPLQVLNQFQQELNRLWDQRYTHRGGDSADATSQWCPAVDVKEEETQYSIFADLPGVDQKDIQINMENQTLTIMAVREFENKEERENFSRIERVSGRCQRRFTLPIDADDENIKANYKQGVLIITIPKKEFSRGRKIEVQAE